MKHLCGYFSKILITPVIIISFFVSSCDEQNDGLAPYAGSTPMSNISVEENSFKPKITWSGGYVSVFAVNYGTRAALDNSIVFLVYKAGNDIRYPVTFGEVPSGAQDLTSQFGGTVVDSLIEDSTYTFWVMKEEEWNQISSMANKILIFDSTLSTSFQVDGDTIRLSAEGHTQITKPLDNYISITNLSTFGRLGTISVEHTNASNNPIINWTVTQSDVDDSLISAIGIVEGGQYNPGNEIWSVYSINDSGGQTLFGKKNVINAPLVAGQSFPETQIFVDYPAEGLARNRTYYIWIANKLWDGEGRIRVTSYYAYATFNTE